MSDIPNLRKTLNSLETSVQNLTDLNVEMNSYGTLLSVTFDRIPNELLFLKNLRTMFGTYETL